MMKSEIKVKRLVIKSKASFEKLFYNFRSLKAISYVISPDFLVELLDNHFERVELVLGEDISDSLKSQLAKKSYEYTLRLAKYIEDGNLKLFLPKRMIHSKLYILESDEMVRVIQSSANLTLSANSSSQINYCWYVDFKEKDNVFLQGVYKDYETHKEKCTFFMEDLIKLLKNEELTSEEQKVKIWLNKDLSSEDSESAVILKEITEVAFSFDDAGVDNSLISIKVDSNSGTPSRKLKNYLKNFGYTESKGSILIDKSKYLDHKLQGIPIMRYVKEKKSLYIGISGKVISLTEKLPNKEVIRKSLEHLEAYFETVDYGVSKNKLMTKMNMYEGMMYIFTSPFFNEYLKQKRTSVGEIDLRGPRYLYLYGPSFNGKTTFLRFVLKIVSGSAILPIPGRQLSKNTILSLANKATSFPLVFDDVPSSKWKRGGVTEEILKNYWEVDWHAERVVPQLIFSSNFYSLKEWAQSRIKPIIFDVHFTEDIRLKEKVSALFMQNNPIYKWFTEIYIKLSEESDTISDDELHISRNVFKKLYEYAGLEIPNYFPTEPVEKVFDYGKFHWQDLINHFQKARILSKHKEFFIEFDDDLKSGITEYLGLLPQNIKFERKGNLIRIDNPNEFSLWFYGEKLNFIEKIKRKLIGKDH